MAARIIDELSASYAPGTVNRSLGALKKALGMARERNRTPVDYSSLVTRVPEDNQPTLYLSMEQVKSIADHASENVRAAIWIALLTDCRRGEVCKIQAADIGKKTTRSPAGNTKTLRYREVPILLGLGVDLPVIREILGHTSIKTTERHARVMVKPQHEAVSKLGALHRDLHRTKKKR